MPVLQSVAYREQRPTKLFIVAWHVPSRLHLFLFSDAHVMLCYCRVTKMCSLIIYIILQHNGGAAAQQFSFLLENFLMPCCLEWILNLAHNKSEIERRVHAVIGKFAEQGLRSLAVAYQISTCLFFHSF
ncbi:hypothetical protein ACSBR2_014536 [Camellia fascicularis]